MRFLDEPDGFGHLEAILAPMRAEGRREIYLDLARAAVETGRSEVAATAARRSREIAPTDSLDARRADLYAAAADVVDPVRNDAAIAALDTMDVAPLPEGDRMLRTAALRLGKAVADLPPPVADGTTPAVDAATGEAPPTPPARLAQAGEPIPESRVSFIPGLAATVALQNEADEPSEIEQRVRETLADVDAILRSSP